MFSKAASSLLLHCWHSLHDGAQTNHEYFSHISHIFYFHIFLSYFTSKFINQNSTSKFQSVDILDTLYLFNHEKNGRKLTLYSKFDSDRNNVSNT